MKKNLTRGFWNQKLYKSLLAMKITFVLILLSSLQISASVYSQNTRLDMNLNNQTLVEVFQTIRNGSEFSFVYDLEDVEDVQNLDISVEDATVEEILDECLQTTNLTYEIIDKVVIVKQKAYVAPQPVQQEKKTLIGKVTDKNGVSLPGVSVVVKGTTTGVSTNIDGEYTINLENGNAVLVYSFVGMLPKELAYNGQATQNVILQLDSENLEEVIVTGYQTVSVERSTGSVVTVKARDVEKKGQSNLLNTLEGMVAGLGISSNPGEEGSKKISIRGTSTINGNSSPLIIIDGFAVETDLSTINPYEIESVNVLKDAASASIYGARSANGVIVITTKRGSKGKSKINYTNNFTFNQKPDLAYRMNRVSSSDLVDIQKVGAGSNPHTYQYYLDNYPTYAGNYAYARNLVFETMAQVNEGSISQAQADVKLDALRSKDNLSQLEDTFTQEAFESQHNLSVSGGSEKNNYRVSLNYTGRKGSWVGDKSERIVFDVMNNLKLSNKVRVDIGANVSMNNNKSIPFNQNVLLNQVSSYELFKDEDGNPLPVRIGRIGSGGSNNAGLFGGKDPVEIQRLIDMGLLDENYRPVDEINNYSNKTKDFFARIQARLYADLFKGVKGTFGFQYERGGSKSNYYAAADSYEMNQLINNASPNDYAGDNNTLNVPLGARKTERRGDRNSYTIRGQLDFDKTLGDHNFRALTGSEVRHVFSSSTTIDKFGFDENTLLFQDVNAKSMGETMYDVNHPMGYIAGGIPMADKFYEKTDRFFSIYGNFSYDYKKKYILSGSARVDQSNLFGTDPEFRYKPFWSVGSKWRIHEESFFDSEFIDALSMRFSYGINGNIANDYGPFNIARSLYSYRAGNVNSLYISSPSIQDLRWERTSTTNFGLDISMLNRKIILGLDYYLKNTDDILASGKADPSQGFVHLMRNDANIKNQGLEISLNTTNLQTAKFNWRTSLAFRYNKNEVKKVYLTEDRAAWVASSLQNFEGKPANSFYLYDWAGLDNEGQVTVNNRNGETVTVADGSYTPGETLNREDLVYAGTSDPKFTGALTNNFSYGNFGLSFMFVFSGGHVLLNDTYNGSYVGSRPSKVHADAAKAWKVAGDENTTDVPKINSYAYAPSVSAYSTKNIIDGDYLKLRELIFTYNLPKHILQKLYLQNAILSFRANNLFYVAKNNEGIDPEAHGIGRRYFPTKPSYSMGININF